MKHSIKLLLLAIALFQCNGLHAQQIKTSSAVVQRVNHKLSDYTLWHMYDSLGYKCLQAEDTSWAIYNYGKALELYPDNTNTSKILERLQYYYLKSGKYYVEEN